MILGVASFHVLGKNSIIFVLNYFHVKKNNEGF